MSYVVKGVRETGTITYHCSTNQHALEKVRDFQRAEYRDIEVVTNDESFVLNGRLLPTARLELLKAA